jgi:hypothetical protein
MDTWEPATAEQVLSFPHGPDKVDSKSTYGTVVRYSRYDRRPATYLVRVRDGRTFVWCVRRRRSQWQRMCGAEGCLLAIQGRGRCMRHQRERRVQQQPVDPPNTRGDARVLLQLADTLLSAYYGRVQCRLLRAEMCIPELRHIPLPTAQ